MTLSAQPPDRRFEASMRKLTDRVLTLEHRRDEGTTEVTQQIEALEPGSFPVIFPLFGPVVISDSMLFKAPAALVSQRFDSTLVIPGLTDTVVQLVIAGVTQPRDFVLPAGETDASDGSADFFIPMGAIVFLRCVQAGGGAVDYQGTLWCREA